MQDDLGGGFPSHPTGCFQVKRSTCFGVERSRTLHVHITVCLVTREPQFTRLTDPLGSDSGDSLVGW